MKVMQGMYKYMYMLQHPNASKDVCPVCLCMLHSGTPASNRAVVPVAHRRGFVKFPLIPVPLHISYTILCSLFLGHGSGKCNGMTASGVNGRGDKKNLVPGVSFARGIFSRYRSSSETWQMVNQLS